MLKTEINNIANNYKIKTTQKCKIYTKIPDKFDMELFKELYNQFDYNITNYIVLS